MLNELKWEQEAGERRAVIDTRNQTIDECRERLLDALHVEAWRAAIQWRGLLDAKVTPSMCNAQLGAALMVQSLISLLDTDGGVDMSIYALVESYGRLEVSTLARAQFMV